MTLQIKCCWWPHMLKTILIQEIESLHQLRTTQTSTQKELWVEVYQLFHVCSHKVLLWGIWKRIQQVTMACQESAGGILACLSGHAELGVSGSHSPFYSLPQWKDLAEGRRKKRDKGGWQGKQERSVWSYSGETLGDEGGLCACFWGRGSALSSSALIQG